MQRFEGRNALLLEGIDAVAADKLRDTGFAVKSEKGKIDPNTLTKRILADKVTLLGIRTGSEIPAELLLETKGILKAVGVFSIGIDKVNTKAALQSDVAVFNAPFSNGRSVAELAVASSVMLLRNINERSAKLQAGTWDKSPKSSHEARQKTLGIVGYGNIGSQISPLAEAFGMKVMYFDLAPKASIGNAQPAVSLDELLGNSDVVTLHLDGKSKKPIIGKAELAKMKKGAYLVNLSRASTVDTLALIDSIESGHLAGAHIDVFDKEPNNGDQFVSPLLNNPKILITPHIGGATEEAQRHAAEYTSGKLLDYMETGNTAGSVNFPNVTLPTMEGTHRFTNLHEDVEGVIAAISKVLAEQKVNITGQALGTRDKHGYVIVDTNQPVQGELVGKLAEVPGSIGVRILY